LDISGTYDLIKYGYEYKKDGRFEPISEYYRGTIQYTADGFMSVTLRFEANPEELTDLVAYSGKYRVDGEVIHHQVTHSVRPDYEGQFLARTFKLEDDMLELEFENTAEFRKFSIWRRLH